MMGRQLARAQSQSSALAPVANANRVATHRINFIAPLSLFGSGRPRDRPQGDELILHFTMDRFCKLTNLKCYNGNKILELNGITQIFIR